MKVTKKPCRLATSFRSIRRKVNRSAIATTVV